MNQDSILPMITLAMSYQVPLSIPVHFAISHTRGLETPAPPDLPLPTFSTPPSGRMLVQVDPRETLVRGSADLVRALAAALPHSPEDERLVAARVAEVMGAENPSRSTGSFVADGPGRWAVASGLRR